MNKHEEAVLTKFVEKHGPISGIIAIAVAKQRQIPFGLIGTGGVGGALATAVTWWYTR